MYHLRSITVYWSRSGRNYYGTKRIFTRVSVPFLLYFEGAIFIKYLFTKHINPPFQNLSAVVWSEIDKVNKFDQIDYNCNVDLYFKSGYLFRTCSTATDLVTSLYFHSNFCYYAVPLLAKYGTISYSLL